MSSIRIGISGWSYPSWRGRFYPNGLPAREELPYASRRMNAVEINATFYRLQRPEHFEAWYAATPPGFEMAVKGGRFITHMKKLRDVDAALGNFFASGLLALKDKLGPVLWQLPERLSFEPERIESFFRVLRWHRGETPPDAELVGRGRGATASGRDVYVFFDNDAKVHAPFDAQRLAARVGSKCEPPSVTAGAVG